jgi:predicted MFS family arabinose efflux permease
VTVDRRAAARRATVAGCAVGLGAGWTISNVGAIADSIARDYHVALATVGLFTTALFVVHAAMQVPAGKAVDAIGARRGAFIGLAAMAIPNALALLAPEPALVISMRALSGIGSALCFVAGIDYVRSHGGSAFAQGIFGGVALSAGGFALAIVPQVEPWLGWRAPFATMIAVLLLAASVLLTGPSDEHRARPERAVGPAPGILRDRRLYRLCVVYMASFGLSVILSNWVVPLLTHAAGYRESTAGLVGSFILLGGVVSRPLGGYLVRRYPARTRPLLGASFAASAAGTGILALAGPPPLAAPGALVLGLAAGIPFAAAFGAATRLRPDAPAVATAVVNMAANVVIVAGTPLMGLSFSLPLDGQLGFAVAVGLWLAALAALPAVRELDPPPLPSPARAG